MICKDADGEKGTRQMTKKQRALEVIERLKQEYPDAGCTLDYDQAWKLLVRRPARRTVYGRPRKCSGGGTV